MTSIILTRIVLTRIVLTRIVLIQNFSDQNCSDMNCSDQNISDQNIFDQNIPDQNIPENGKWQNRHKPIPKTAAILAVKKISMLRQFVLSYFEICLQNWHFITKENVLKLKISIQNWSFKFGIYFTNFLVVNFQYIQIGLSW